MFFTLLRIRDHVAPSCFSEERSLASVVRIPELTTFTFNVAPLLVINRATFLQLGREEKLLTRLV